MTAFIGRRDFVTLLGSAAAWPIAARAQQRGKSARVGYLFSQLLRPTTILRVSGGLTNKAEPATEEKQCCLKSVNYLEGGPGGR